MSDEDMGHMEFLAKVAMEDVDHLRMKEATYRGSWKRRGGVGAFMMMARKWDRLESMLSVDTSHDDAGYNYDIFQAITDRPSGADGTPLAEIRDLRRYLLLIESEMHARGTFETSPRLAVAATAKDLARAAGAGINLAETKPVRTISRDFERCCAACGEAIDGLGESWCEVQEDGSIRYYHHAHRPPQERSVPRTPDDGGQHNALAPWVCGQDYFLRKSVDVAMRSTFWNQRAPATHVLESHVESENIPRVLGSLYRLCADKRSWTIDIARVPPDAREYFPSLEVENNWKEWSDLSRWQQDLYEMQGMKYVLKDRAWHAES